MNVSAQTYEFTIYGIWEGLCSFLGITGNIILLYTFIEYPRAIQLDHVSTAILKNMAVVDLVSALLVPSTLSISYLLGGGVVWPMSEVWCVLYTYIKHGPTVASILLVMAFSLYRLYRIIRPLRSRDVDEVKLAASVVVLAWTLAVLTPVYMMYFHLTGHLQIRYLSGKQQYGTCAFVDVIHDQSFSVRPRAYLAVVLIFLPGIITFISNTILISYIVGKPFKLSLRLKTTIMITTIFILTYFPYATVVLISSCTSLVPAPLARHVSARFISVGCWYNLPTYLYLDKKLQEFVVEMVAAGARCRKVPPPLPPLTARMRFRGAAQGVAAAISMSKAASTQRRGATQYERISPRPGGFSRL